MECVTGVCVFGSGRSGMCWGEWLVDLGQGLGGRGGGMTVCVVCLDPLC